MTKQIAVLSLLALGFVACKDETVDSEDIRTSGVHAEFEVLAIGNAKAATSAKLTVGTGDTSLVLTGEDKLQVTAADVAKTMTRDGDYYRWTFSGDAGGTVFNFAFNRGTDNDSAPSSTVTLPDPFNLVGPAATAEVSRADVLTVTWEVSTTVVGDAVATTWKLEGDCLNAAKGNAGTVVADGTLTLTGTDYTLSLFAQDALNDPNDDSENCTATLCIERKSTNGTLDSAFDKYGGSVNAIQRRCTKFVSVP